MASEIPLLENTIEEIIKKREWFELKCFNETYSEPIEREPFERERLRLLDREREEREREHQERERQDRREQCQDRQKERAHQLEIIRLQGDEQPPAKKPRGSCCAYGRPFKIPSASTKAASYNAKNPTEGINPKRRKLPLFSHWFATDIYNFFYSWHTPSDNNIKLLDNQPYTLQKDTLTKCAVKIRSIALFCSGDVTSVDSFLSEDARGHEDSFSSLLTPVFNKLFGDAETVTFFNQMVIKVREGDKRKNDKPDNIATGTLNGIPTICGLVSDSKETNMPEGTNQVHAYGLSLESKYLFLGMPITFSMVKLQLFIAFDSKLSVIDICDAKCGDVDDLKRFLCTLYAALRKLLDTPIVATSQHSFTLKCCEQEVLCMQEGEHIQMSDNSQMSGNSQVLPLVVHCTRTNTVRKYYDTLFHYLPTVEAIGFIPSAQFVYPLGSRCQILEYPFIIGCHTLETPLQAVMAVKKLQLFHERDLVHGDIRSTNMIVSEDSVIFIDVDLVQQEGEKYPGTYNHAGIPERHKDAIANSLMHALHDRFALYVILSQTPFVSANQLLCQAVTELLDMDKSLEAIATKISEAEEQEEGPGSGMSTTDTGEL